MEHYLVFTGRKWKNVMGEEGITWEICGIFKTDTADMACIFAAQRTGAGTCFAIPGTAWGVDTIQADQVEELGARGNAMARLEKVGRSIEQSILSLATTAQQKTLPPGSDDE